ncbi:coronin-1B-like isoform X3 [Ruditapes philippinarum]|uniref:coronin-1B-like isoform X3 n=1 Tax=Ruditapes philippinarum TaxID=129788 RepID=UPI00295B0DFA|nr:coronin-1B-like isoform X3 [Ruditapes philippinarum]
MHSSEREMAFRMRSSKFRHIYGDAHRKEKCYENIRLTRNAHDSNFCAVNPKYLAVVTESSGGGAFVVLPLAKTGRVDINAPKVCGHAGGVLDIKWSPFHDDVIASGSDDCTVKVWQIPNGGLISNLSEWQVDLHGHGRRVTYIEWHPTADNIILSAGLDYKCIIWNVEQAEPVNVINCHNDIIQSISWNREGSLFSTTCKDKTLRIIDPRVGDCVAEVNDVFKGVRPMKSVMLGDTGKVFCTGFQGNGEREMAIWDIKNMKNALTRKTVDNSNGILMPYYDHDTRVVFLAGKGDGNIRYYELTDESPYCHFLNVYGSSSPQRGLGVMPKRGCDASRCEIMRFYKLHAARNFVEPLSMIVPRKSNIFHDDIFPPTASAIPSLSADEWISGQNREPILISMKDQHVVNDPSYTPSRAGVPQDGALNEAPTITTYRAVSSSQNGGSGEPAKIPASLKNIKRLSTCEDVVTLTPSSQTSVERAPPNTNQSSSPSIVDSQSDKAFVNSKIAAFENKGSNNNTGEVGTSPSRRQFDRRSWSTSQENPPDVIANGIKGTNESSKGPNRPVNIKNAAQYFEHREIQIIDIQDRENTKKLENRQKDGKNAKSLPVRSTPAGRLILGEVNEHRSKQPAHKIHVKKTWSPIKPPSNPMWEDMGDVPNTDPELRKAYFQQAQEIKALKEQLALKDKRIRQLEDEANLLKKSANEESNC